MYFTSVLNTRNKYELLELIDFLKSHDVIYDYPERTLVIRDNGKIIATASVDGKILKYFFVDENYLGQGILVILYNDLLNYLLENEILDHFVFTSPKNYEIFNGIGLKEVIRTDEVLLLEGGFSNYSDWVEKVRVLLNPLVMSRGAIVANCNPMTLGHKFLMEFASEKVDELIVFIVEEDKSAFTTEERFSIVAKEFGNHSKIKVVHGGPYIISSATFPTYFLKELNSLTDVYTKLDATIFSEKIARDLNINIRFVGNEPLDKMTARYNENLKKYITREGLSLEIIERIQDNKDYISASRVRKLLKENNIEEALELCAPSTVEFLTSERGKEKIKELQYEKR